MVQTIERIVLFVVIPVIMVWLLSIMPAIVINNKDEIITGLDSIVQIIGSVNSFFPVVVFFQCMIVWALIYYAEMLLKLGLWLLRKLPLGIN